MFHLFSDVNALYFGVCAALFVLFVLDCLVAALCVLFTLFLFDYWVSASQCDEMGCWCCGAVRCVPSLSFYVYVFLLHLSLCF